MDEALKKISAEIKAEFDAWLEAPETKKTIEATEKAAAADTGSFEVVITTENLDRYQEVIKLEGWELEHYMKNPVVLWGHDHKQLPIGIATEVAIVDGKMIAKGKFAPHEFAQTIRQLYDMGMMRATSVGFLEKEREGNLITKAELLEFSFVSVPANPFALSTLVKSGVSINEMVTKGIVMVKEEEPVAPEGEDVPEPTEKEKGAVQDETDAQKAREQKWRNFMKVDDVVFSFYKVYMDSDTQVADFNKLLDETIELLKQVSGSEKEFTFGETIKEILPSGMRKVWEHQDAFRSLTPDQIKGYIIALEALSKKDEEPEGNDAPTDDEEQKTFKEFSDKRRKLQEASTILGEVLAEARQAIEAKSL